MTDSQGAAVSVSLSVNVTSGASGSAALDISFNRWPVVSKVSASLNQLDVGQSTSVSATASDADGDALSYQWTASCPGTWTNATSSNAAFVPSSVPAGGCNNCRLTVAVQDGRGGQTTGSLNLCVASSTTARFPPAITNFYQSASSTTSGQTVTFDVTALDPQSSSLTFSWTASAGSLGAPQSAATTSRVVWTAPSCVPSVITPTITAVVTNAYGFSTSKAFSVSGLPTCPAAWSSAGSMASPRAYHTATLLLSGKVLVTGGSDGSVPLASAQLYDPANNSWSSAGNMAQARRGHTATRLPSGKVLIAGGYSSSNNASALNSAEVYDPANNSWSPAPNMAQAHIHGTATLLNSGKVLVAAGDSNNSGELYDPVNNSWSSAGNLAQVRPWHTATLLNSGKVLVAGGGYPTMLASAELYDPATNSWSSAGTMASVREEHVAALLASGKVLIAAGYVSNSSPYVTASAELYDPATNSWSSTNPKAQACDAPSAIVLASGKVLVSGGWSGIASTSAEIYDPATNTWSSTSNLAQGRSTHTSTLLPSGRVLVTGGAINGNATSCTATAELYTP